MFALSQYPMPSAKACDDTRTAPLPGGEGHECEACRRATADLLLPGGRPGGWLLLLAAVCVVVLCLAIALRLA
jgi:hypothetical protein